MKKIVLIGLMVATIYSCETLHKIDEGTKAITSYSLEDIAQGAAIYKFNCGKCHALPKLSQYNMQEWEPIMNRMLDKSKITEAQARKQAFAYVNTNCKKEVTSSK